MTGELQQFVIENADMPKLDSIETAAAAIRSGAVTSESLTLRCLERINQLDSRLQAWVLVDPEQALASARRLDLELREGHDRGPLHGIPVGIKDLLDVAGWPTRAGIDAWDDRLPARQDAFSVALLRNAGAVFLGKTVTTQLACFDPARTINPWNPACTPGGSSSGSAVAVATGMCFAALGTQTGGSVIRPAAFCGISGMKPTYRGISLRGVLPVSLLLDHVGPMARSMSDLRILWHILAREDPSNPSPELDSSEVADLPNGQFRKIIGLCGSWWNEQSDPDVWSPLRLLVGADAEEFELPLDFEAVIKHHRILMVADLAGHRRGDDSGTRDCYEPGIRSLMAEADQLGENDRMAAVEHQQQARRTIDAWWSQHPLLAALLLPAAPGGAPDRSTTGSPVMNSPWSYLGLPTVSFPVGFDASGLPISAQLAGRRHSDLELLRLAEELSDRVAFPGWSED